MVRRTPRGRVLARMLPLAAAALVVAALAGCAGARIGSPALPPGFTKAGLPMEAQVAGYLYFNSGDNDVTIPLAIFRNSSGALDPSEVVGIRQLVGAMSDTADQFGAHIQFSEQEGADLAKRLMEEHLDRSRGHLSQAGQGLVLTRGDGPWTRAVQEAWQSGRQKPLEDRYPDTWELLRLLPERPPAPPVAAGFLRRVPEVVESLMERRGVSAPGLGSALSFVRAREVAFALYGSELNGLPTDLTEEQVRESKLGMIAVTGAGYPGFVIRFLLSSFAGRAGMEEVPVEEDSAWYRILDNRLHLMLKSYGATMFFTVASSQEGALKLMQAVMENQAGE